MIESTEHRECLIKIAEKLKPLKQSIPIDNNGNPTEEYLEYLSLMYPLEIANIVQFLNPFPSLMTIFKLSRLVGIPRNELNKLLHDTSQKLYLVKIAFLYALPTPLFIFDGPFILQSSYKGKNAKKFAYLGKTNVNSRLKTRIYTLSNSENTK